MKASRRSILALTVLLAITSRASAAVITFQFSARVTNVAGDHRLSGAMGEVISGWYSFDSGAADGNTNPHIGNYGTALPFQVDIAGEWMRWNGAAMDVYDDPSGPRFWQDAYFVSVYAGGHSSLHGLRPDHFEFLMQASSGGGPLTSDALLLAPPGFSQLRPLGFELTFTDRGHDGYLGGELTSLTRVTDITAIPEPSLLLLAGAGAIAWGVRRATRR